MRPWHQFHLHWEQNWRELGSKPSQIVSREGERRESHKTNSIFKRWHFTPIVTQVKTKVGCWNQLAMNKLELNEPPHMPVANIFGGWIPHASVSWVLGMKAAGLRPPTQLTRFIIIHLHPHNESVKIMDTTNQSAKYSISISSCMKYCCYIVAAGI